MSTEATATTVPTPAEAKPIRKVFVIPEGYIQSHTFEDWGVTITFKPMRGHDLARHLDKLAPLKTGEEIFNVESDMAAAQLTSWSITDDDGKVVPITAETVGGLQPVAFRTALINRICGL